MDAFGKIFKNANLKPVTILTKMFILEAWMDPEYASAGGNFWTTFVKIEIGIISYLQSKDGIV